MNGTLSPDIIELIQQTSTSDSDDINDKIRAICADLIQATNIGQSVFGMYENITSDKNASDERNRQYGVITAGALKELEKLQNRENNTINPLASNTPDFKIIMDNSSSALLHFQGQMEDFANNVYDQLDSANIQISNISNFVKSSKNQVENLSKIFACSPQEVESRALALLEDNDNCRQMLHLIIENIKGENSNFDSLDSLLGQLGINDANIQLPLSQFFEFAHQINELSEMLHTGQKNVNAEVAKLIEISKEATKPKFSQPPPPQIVDTTEFEEEIARLKQENEILDVTRNQLINEKSNLVERVAHLQSQLAAKSSSTRLSFTRYDYLATISPSKSSNDFDSSFPQSMSQEEIDELLSSKDNTIAELNYQLQITQKSLKENQENSSTEIESLNDIIRNLQIEKDKKESLCVMQQKELNQLKIAIDSLPQSELVRSLSSFFGGCSNEEEILNNVFGMKNEILKLRVKASENEMNESKSKSKDAEFSDAVNKKRITELQDQLEQATDQISSLQDQISTLQKDKGKLLNDYTSLDKQIQVFRDNEAAMKNEISSSQKRVRDSTRACERLQAEFDLSSAQLSEIKGKYELFENESAKLLDSVNKLATKIASMSQSQQRQNKGNHSNGPSNSFDEIIKVCEALQLIFMQYTMSDFSNNDKTSSDLLISIEQLTNISNQSHIPDEDVLTNEIMKDIIHEKASTFVDNVGKIFNSINEKFNTTLESFDGKQTEIIQIFEEQQNDLMDYRINDYAVPYSALKASYSELQEKYDAITKNMEPMEQDQFVQFERHPIQSRFQNSTPPRNASSRGSRSSIQSPSEIVLERTIQQNYNRTRFNQ